MHVAHCVLMEYLDTEPVFLGLYWDAQEAYMRYQKVVFDHHHCESAHVYLRNNVPVPLTVDPNVDNVPVWLVLLYIDGPPKYRSHLVGIHDSHDGAREARDSAVANWPPGADPLKCADIWKDALKRKNSSPNYMP